MSHGVVASVAAVPGAGAVADGGFLLLDRLPSAASEPVSAATAEHTLAVSNEDSVHAAVILFFVALCGFQVTGLAPGVCGCALDA